MRNQFRRAESRSLPRPENELPLLATYNGTNITPTTALAIADVSAAVRVLADAASSLPLHVYRKTGRGGGQAFVNSTARPFEAAELEE